MRVNILRWLIQAVTLGQDFWEYPLKQIDKALIKENGEETFAYGKDNGFVPVVFDGAGEKPFKLFASTNGNRRKPALFV